MRMGFTGPRAEVPVSRESGKCEDSRSYSLQGLKRESVTSVPGHRGLGCQTKELGFPP